MRLSRYKVLLTITLETCAVFATVGFAHAQLGHSRGAATTQAPLNIRGPEISESQESTLREPCTLVSVAHLTHGSESANSAWAEYDLGSARDVTAVLLDNSQNADSSKAIYTVLTGTAAKPTYTSGKVEISSVTQNSVYIPFSGTATLVSVVRIEQMVSIKNSATLQHALICGTHPSQNEIGATSSRTTNTSNNPIVTIPPSPNCPGGDLYVNKTELLVGETQTAIAPPMWYDGQFVSSNAGIVVIDGNIVRAVAPGTAQIYGTDFKGGNNRGCVTKAVTVRVK